MKLWNSVFPLLWNVFCIWSEVVLRRKCQDGVWRKVDLLFCPVKFSSTHKYKRLNLPPVWRHLQKKCKYTHTYKGLSLNDPYYVYVQIHHSIIRAFMLFCINFHYRPNLALNQQHCSALQSWSMEAVDVKWVSLSIFLVNCSLMCRLLMVPIGLLRVHVCFRAFINI